MSLPSAVASSERLASVDDPRPQLDKVQIEAIELVFGEDNALDDATPDSRDKVFATQWFSNSRKRFGSCSQPLELKFKSSKLTASSFIFRR